MNLAVSWRPCMRVLLLLSGAPSFAQAETPTSPPAAKATAATPAQAPSGTTSTGTAASGTTATAQAPAAAGAAATAPVRRDPKGRTGISPTMEAIVRGDAAFLARDFVAAASAYQEAIKLEPQKASGHLRMASLHLALGELDQATVVLATAERFTGGDATLTIQTLALKAMLAEARAALSDASLAWSAYSLLARAGGPAVSDALIAQAIMTTAADRKTAITAATERQTAYAKVRERIEKGLADANLTEAPSSVPAK